MRRNTLSRLGAMIGALATALAALPAGAGEAPDPLASLAALAPDDLAGLTGRQGISISGEEFVAITGGGHFEAGGDIETGGIDFGRSMQRLSGINTQAINTGNDANMLAGTTVHIHLH